MGTMESTDRLVQCRTKEAGERKENQVVAVFQFTALIGFDFYEKWYFVVEISSN